MNALFQSLVAKPDQLIKRRGKLGLIKVKASLEEVKQWIAERMGRDQEVRSGQSIGFDTVLTNGGILIRCWRDESCPLHRLIIRYIGGHYL